MPGQKHYTEANSVFIETVETLGQFVAMKALILKQNEARQRRAASGNMNATPCFLHRGQGTTSG